MDRPVDRRQPDVMPPGQHRGTQNDAADRHPGPGLAHELNQSLHVIRLTAEALEYDAMHGALDPARVAGRAATILAATDQMAALLGPPATTATRTARTAMAGGSILLVDDEPLSVMMVSEFLARLGYEVETARDGDAAFALCQERLYDAVITDINMPRMDGAGLIARLEELQPGTPVIVMTGQRPGETAIVPRRNVAAVLTKPFQLQDLRRHLAGLEMADRKEQEEGA